MGAVCSEVVAPEPFPAMRGNMRRDEFVPINARVPTPTVSQVASRIAEMAGWWPMGATAWMALPRTNVSFEVVLVWRTLASVSPFRWRGLVPELESRIYGQ